MSGCRGMGWYVLVIWDWLARWWPLKSLKTMWKNVLCSNEAKVECLLIILKDPFGTKTDQKKTAYHKKNITPMVKHSAGNMMPWWGCFFKSGAGVKIEGTMDYSIFQSIHHPTWYLKAQIQQSNGFKKFWSVLVRAQIYSTMMLESLWTRHIFLHLNISNNCWSVLYICWELSVVNVLIKDSFNSLTLDIFL